MIKLFAIHVWKAYQLLLINLLSVSFRINFSPQINDRIIRNPFPTTESVITHQFIICFYIFFNETSTQDPKGHCFSTVPFCPILPR